MIDHVVLATDDLERTVAHITDEWGVTPTPGGAHVGMGTRNELVGIGDGAYLEIVGPDLDQRDHAGVRPFGVGGRSGDALAAWCARPSQAIELAAAAAARCDHDVGPISAMSRRRPDGVLLEWRLTFPPAPPAVMPFLIDWLSTEHPTATLRHPVKLIELHLHSPHADAVRCVVDAIGGDDRITVHDDSPTRLTALLRTPSGVFTLTS